VKAEDLIVLAAAHGIDLKHIAGASAPTSGPSVRRRSRTREEIAANIPVRETVRGTSTRTMRRAAWSLAELGQAAQGVPRIPWLAACFAFAGDDRVFWELHRALRYEAEWLQRHHEWSAQVIGADGAPRFYIEALAQLVLDEERHAHLFAAAPATEKRPSLYAIYLHIEEPLWKRRIFERFDLLKLRYLGWLDTASAMIQRKLGRPPEELADEAQRPQRENRHAVPIRQEARADW
jgi:hypothetical protein